MENMTITNAQYCNGIDFEGNSTSTAVSIIATIDGEEKTVPIDPANRHYAEIMRQVDAGELTIAEAD